MSSSARRLKTEFTLHARVTPGVIALQPAGLPGLWLWQEPAGQHDAESHARRLLASVTPGAHHPTSESVTALGRRQSTGNLRVGCGFHIEQVAHPFDQRFDLERLM